MKQFIKTYWKTLAFFAAAGLVGGFLTGLFLMDSYPDEIRQQLLDQKITDTALGLITALQAAGYGIVLGAITLLVWCKMENEKLPRMSGKNLFRIAYAIVAVLVLGLGLCMCLVWQQFVWGTLVGLLGIVMLIALIPMIKGIK